MLLDDLLDSCHCRCSPGDCTPFMAGMKHMQLCNSQLGIATTFTECLKEYGNAFQRKHYYAAIGFTTFQALGVARTCICKGRYWTEPTFDADEIVEIPDEYSELLKLLESSIEEFESHAFEIFEAATDGFDSIVTFWNG
ncbi:uncharacterized protein TRIVIDRAFT_215271 [Trichoderma virens Gv29-8]|uniref:Uncharacterized protein n=1 Tax=Hypocrea virens (strain Gv29-8 / FGSC 10586) TaxID=413071 RepID=G9MFT3_HYPVG|nr:uncharacterized protein TRIVIDRAFT_215271 [Trichoderma virens Gv29-8]EHK26384.1 hypothetical protein TRIVIDRAFT_215271 [Trichoderma virens Gv29-8]